jgi:glycosyltransferase involved in cell wall biosynthesis
VHYLRYRYPHHAAASGYDRICDYVESETVYPSPALYWAGETLLRPSAMMAAKFGGHFEYSRYDWVAERGFRGKMRQAHDAIFHIVYAEKSLRTAHRLADQRGNRLVLTVHHPKEHHTKLFPNFDHFRSAAAIITLTTSLRETWAGIVGPERVHHIPYGIDIDYFTPGVRDKSRKRCLFSGYHGRDFDLLEKAALALTQHYSDFELWVLSSAPEALGIARISDRVKVIRRIDDEAYLDALRHFDLMILPVKANTANTAVLEAMACGLPIVTNEGSPTDYMDASCGHILPAGDADGLIAACIELLDDPVLRHRYGKGARDRAERFSWSAVAKQTVGLYEAL